jgi:hypothetical protein
MLMQISSARQRTAAPGHAYAPLSDGASIRSRRGEPVFDGTSRSAGPCGVLHRFSSLRVFPVQSNRDTAIHADIPFADGSGDVDDQPDAGATPSGAAPLSAAGSTDSCAQPLGMQKITSGAFLGGLTVDNYYPDLAGTGRYGHPATAGTYDTGTRAGANIQLIGVIPAPCAPGQYSLAQTVTRTRFRRNGAVLPEEGMTFDDLGKSGRDVSNAPFRQEFLGGSGAPLGYIISMADEPNTAYGATDTIEHDRTFTSSLVGPGGSKSVSWSLSTRITNGAITKNDFG